MLQRNTSGQTLAVMTSPPCEIEPGGEIEHDDPITGFEVVDVQPAGSPVSHEAPDPSVGELPAAVEPVAAEPVEPVPAEPVPAVPAAPVVAVEPAPAAPESQQVPVWPPAQLPAPGSVVST